MRSIGHLWWRGKAYNLRPGEVPIIDAGPTVVYATLFRVETSRKNDALVSGVRFCLLKSTDTSPKRFPVSPAFHSKLSITLHWK